MKSDRFIERHILIGLITSTEYLKEIHEVWDHRFLKTQISRTISRWCLDYFDKYGKAPNADIEAVYFEKLKKNDIPEDLAEEIEEDFLPDLSDEYERSEKFNYQYLIDQTREYFSERNLELHQEEIQELLDDGKIKEAEELQNAYSPLKNKLEADIDLSDPKSLNRVEQAFEAQAKPILEYPGALGDHLNQFMTRDAFVAILAPEKRGKSFFMLDAARRGVKQRLNVAFFQAGDMSESQQIRRLGIHLAKKSDLEKYAGEMWQPVKDCIHNQSDSCNLDIRERPIGLDGEDAPVNSEAAREGMTFTQLRHLYDGNPEYRPCYNCKEFQYRNWGCSWLEKVDVGPALRKDEAVKIFQDYFIDKKRNFRISTHPNNTLTTQKIDSILDDWYRRDGFVADMIVIDYADLLVDNSTPEFRQQQNNIWKNLRSLSEKRHALVLSATQADARAYQIPLLDLSNFSEDKRKYAHVTAMFGLNQDPEGREKGIGIMRINTLVARDAEYTPKKVVHVLQNLKRGQPILTSYH